MEKQGISHESLNWFNKEELTIQFSVHKKTL